MLKRNYKDIAGGAFVALLGVYVLVTAFGFGIGTARRMDAGYYPMLLGIASILLGSGIFSLGLRESGTGARIAWKSFLTIITGLVVFYLLVDRAGLIPAIWGLTGIAAIADEDLGWRSTIVLMLIVSFGAWLLFSVILKLPIDGITGVL